MRDRTLTGVHQHITVSKNAKHNFHCTRHANCTKWTHLGKQMRTMLEKDPVKVEGVWKLQCGGGFINNPLIKVCSTFQIAS